MHVAKLFFWNRKRVIIFAALFSLLFLFTPTIGDARVGASCTSDGNCELGEICGTDGTCLATPASIEDTQTEEELFNRGLRGAGGLLGKAAGTAGFPTVAPREPEVIIGQLIQGAILVIGVVFGILVIYGGYLWMTARGNEDQAKKSMDILKTAVIGFILVIAAYSITNFVVDRIITAAFTP